MAEVDDAANDLCKCKDNIEKCGIARLHGDTLEKRGINVDQFLSPSMDKDLKKIKYFSRINKKVKDNFLRFQEFRLNKPETFSEQGYTGQWDKLLSIHIKTRVTDDNRFRFSPATGFTRALVPSGPAEELIATICYEINKHFSFKFLQSKFALFGFMRDRTVRTKLYLWQGEADAIAYNAKEKKYIIVDFKVVDNLSYYWESKTDLCGKHLHQCLVYARLLQLHMDLDYLPRIMIVVIDGFTGRQAYFPLFADYPEECKDKLDEYEWFTEEPQKPPLKIAKNDKMMDGVNGDVPSDTPLKTIFKDTATVGDLLKALDLGYDALKIVPHLHE